MPDSSSTEPSSTTDDTVVTHTGLLLACLLPLVICWYLLHRRVEPADDQAVAEVLLEDLVTDRPLLLPPTGSTRAIGSGDYGREACLPNSAEGVEEST